MSQSPFGGVNVNDLAPVTALDTGQTDLILTNEQFERMHNTAIRRFAAELDHPEINGKSAQYVSRQALVCQRSLNEYADD